NFSGEATPPTGTFDGPAVDLGGSHSCGIKSSGGLACWGKNDLGQATPPGGTSRSLAAGLDHNCTIKTNSTLACWGSNGSGQAISLSGRFVALSAGQDNTCAVHRDGDVLCWGSNAFGKSEPPDSFG